jgi:hypothetical protein
VITTVACGVGVLSSEWLFGWAALLEAFGLFTVVTELAEGTVHAHLTLAAAVAWLIAGLGVAELRRLSHEDAASSMRVEFTARRAYERVKRGAKTLHSAA